MTKEQLLQKLDDLCMESVHQSKKLKPPYSPGYFIQMRAVDGIEKTVHTLINKEEMTEGFARMWEYKRLDLTIQCLTLFFNACDLGVDRRFHRLKISLTDLALSFATMSLWFKVVSWVMRPVNCFAAPCPAHC